MGVGVLGEGRASAQGTEARKEGDRCYLLILLWLLEVRATAAMPPPAAATATPAMIAAW
jgi:hypothetical protein